MTGRKESLFLRLKLILNVQQMDEDRISEKAFHSAKLKLNSSKLKQNIAKLKQTLTLKEECGGWGGQTIGHEIFCHFL